MPKLLWWGQSGSDCPGWLPEPSLSAGHRAHPVRNVPSLCWVCPASPGMLLGTLGQLQCTFGYVTLQSRKPWLFYKEIVNIVSITILDLGGQNHFLVECRELIVHLSCAEFRTALGKGGQPDGAPASPGELLPGSTGKMQVMSCTFAVAAAASCMLLFLFVLLTQRKVWFVFWERLLSPAQAQLGAQGCLLPACGWTQSSQAGAERCGTCAD